MNIDDYKAMIAAESKQEESIEAEEEVVEQKEEITAVVEDVPVKIVIDDEEFDAEKIKQLKAGFLRTEDYTQKTQEVARIRRENQDAIELYNYLKANPQIAKQMLDSEQITPEDIKKLETLDPEKSRVSEMERELNDLRLKQEIATLQEKYDDFDVVEVLKYAYDEKINNLERAYKLVKADKPAEKAPVKEEIDKEALKEELRKELLAEMEREGTSTKTIISSKGTPPKQEKSEVTLTPEQDAVRRKQRLSVEDYIKWSVKK